MRVSTITSKSQHEKKNFWNLKFLGRLGQDSWVSWQFFTVATVLQISSNSLNSSAKRLNISKPFIETVLSFLRCRDQVLNSVSSHDCVKTSTRTYLKAYNDFSNNINIIWQFSMLRVSTVLDSFWLFSTNSIRVWTIQSFLIYLEQV